MYFVGVNENVTTFLHTFEKGGQENVFLVGEKVFFSPFFKSDYMLNQTYLSPVMDGTGRVGQGGTVA